jgi:hypothetical protein|tara:strand:+ start:774 stop:1028 length:255 start_codon:yes stop_codon:yes gene_type:complete
MESNLLKRVHAQNLQDFTHTHVQSELFLETGHYQIHRNRYPYLSFYGVLAVAEEGLDTQVLFDPFEEQLDVPAPLVDFGYLYGG